MVKGNLFIVAAPSGAGKSSLVNALLERHKDGNIEVSVSHTTRSPRPGEENGQHYHFVSETEFKALIDENAFFEWAEVAYGNYYGTSKAAIADKLAKGIDVFLDIDWQGARQVKELMPETRTIFIAPPSRNALEQRLRNRKQDSEDVIAKRMRLAKDEISHYQEFDYIVINDDFETALTELERIVFSQRLNQQQQSVRHKTLFEDLLKD